MDRARAERKPGARLALLLALLLALPGCRFAKNFPVTTGAAAVGAVIAGGPVVLVFLPFTIWSDEEVVILGPGVPTGAVGALALAAPTFVLEFLVWIPRQLFSDPEKDEEKEKPDAEVEPAEPKTKPKAPLEVLVPADPEGEPGQEEVDPRDLDPLAPPRPA